MEHKGLWTAAVVLLVVVGALWRHWRNDSDWTKALKEVLAAVILGAVVLGALTLLSGCASGWYRENATEVAVYAAFDPEGSPFGRSPTGNLVITQPLPGYAQLWLHHESSMPDFDDKASTNEIGVGFCFKVPMKRCN